MRAPVQVYVGVEESKIFFQHLQLPWGVAGQRDVRACKAGGEALHGVFLSCVCGREIDHRLGGLRPLIHAATAGSAPGWVLQVRWAAGQSLLRQAQCPCALAARARW